MDEQNEGNQCSIGNIEVQTHHRIWLLLDEFSVRGVPTDERLVQ
jgi:hypothetical protein